MSVVGATDLGNGLKVVRVDHDPTAVATDAPTGSIIIDASGNHFRKLDNGSTTNITDPISVKDNLTATSNPSINNDDSESYQVGSRWVSNTSDEAFICADASTGAAVWKSTTSGFDDTGFPNIADSTISFTDGTKVFQIAPAVSTFDIIIQGIRYVKSGAESVDLDTPGVAEGVWFIYYDITGTLKLSQTSWNLLIHAPVAYIYWDNINLTAIILGDERHGVKMMSATHEYLHFTFGSQYSSGLGATPKTAIPGTGAADADAEIDFDDGNVFDEDFLIDIQDSGVGNFVQDIRSASGGQLPIFFRSGASGDWRKRTADNFPLIYSGDGSGFTGASGRAAFNDPSGPWTLVQVGNNNYVAIWVCATNNVNEPLIVIEGQREDGSLSDAQINSNPEDILWGTLPFQEVKILYRVIFQTVNGYTNTAKARIRDITDFRPVQAGSIAGSIAGTSHSSLSGRDATGSHPAGAIETDTTNFDGALSVADIDVQTALETLDNSISAVDLFFDFVVEDEIIAIGASPLSSIDVGYDLPIGAIPIAAWINIQSAITGAGGATTLAVGTLDSIAKYGETVALTLDSKATSSIGGAIALGVAEDIKIRPTAGNEAVTGTLVNGSVRVRVLYMLPSDLPNA